MSICSTSPTDNQPGIHDPAADLVWGAANIGRVIGISREKVYYLIKTRDSSKIPVSYINDRTIVASRKKLTKWAAEIVA
jgi:hypothetical protein